MSDKLTKYILKPLGILLIVWGIIMILISLGGFTITIWSMFLMTTQGSYGC